MKAKNATSPWRGGTGGGGVVVGGFGCWCRGGGVFVFFTSPPEEFEPKRLDHRKKSYRMTAVRLQPEPSPSLPVRRKLFPNTMFTQSVERENTVSALSQPNAQRGFSCFKERVQGEKQDQNPSL